MQENKNNAVEKALKAQNDNGQKTQQSSDRTVKNKKSKNSTKTSKSNKESQQKNKNLKKSSRQSKLNQKQKARKEKQEERLKQRAERERVQAEKRVELARIKAHKKAEKEKAKATALREKNRRRAEQKERKQALKEERIKRREMLKNESKKDRQNRLREQRLAMLEEKKRKREEKAQIRREKSEQRKSQKERKQRSKSNKRSGIGGWITAVISLGVATLVLASVLTFTLLMPTASDNMLEAGYSKSFYDTVSQVDNIDLNLSKIMASKDTGAIQQYLVDTAINSELAENDIQQLPLQDESKYYTAKLINQIGDYSKYLNKKLINGEKLSAQDMEGLNRLYKANRTLKQSLQRMVEQMGTDFSFSSLMDNDRGNLVISELNELQNLSVQYPELIYDGPFSDGQVNREIKGLKGEEVDQNSAIEEFKKIFSNYQLTNVECVGTTAGSIETYNVQAEMNGDIIYAQISKKGGKLIDFAYAGDCNEVKIDKEEAISKAEEFLSELGLNDMAPVWINLANNVYTINFALLEEDVTVYSDLVKVRVCGQTGMVIGIEASTYYTNHTDRVISQPTLSKEQARAKVNDSIDVDTVRLVVVPIGASTEKLCYEFSGTLEGQTYYVYIDAMNGRQIEMFKVVSGTEGELLM